MAAIKVTKYRNLAQKYANAQKQIAGVSDYYFSAAYQVVLQQAFDPELDLLQPYYNAYLASQTVYLQAPSAVVTAVGKLQRHILDKARNETAGAVFSDINDWIDAQATNGSSGATLQGREGDQNESFQVAPEFAALSGQAGFVIETENIDPAL